MKEITFMYAFKKIIFISLTLLLLTASFTTRAVENLDYTKYLQIKCGAGDQSIANCVETIVKYVITLAFPVAVIFIIISGFLFVTSAGDPGKLEKAKSTLTWTIIGIAIAVAAWTLAVAFKAFFETL